MNLIICFGGTGYGTEYSIVEIGECTVSALSAGAYTTSLYVLVDIAKGAGREHPLYQAGLIFPS